MTDEEKAQLALQAQIDQWQAKWRDLAATFVAAFEGLAEAVRAVLDAILPIIRRIARWWYGYDAYRVPVPVGWYRVRFSARHPAVAWMPPMLA